MTQYRRMLRLGIAAAIGLLAMIAGSPAIAQSTDLKALEAAARKEPPMTWYISFYGQEPADKAVKEFAKLYPGIQVLPIRQTSGANFQRLNQDIKSGKMIASVVSLSGVGGYYDILLRDGRLDSYEPAEAKKLSPELQPTIVPGLLYPIGSGLMTIAYNTTKVAPADVPKTWKDLADPKWKGKLALSHPAFSGFDAAWVVSMDKMGGWAYFDSLAKNNPLVQRSTFDSLRALNAAERLVAVTGDMIVLESAAKGNPVSVVYPSDGSVLVPGFTAILKGAPQPATARLFTEFLMGVEHARIVAEARYQTARPEVVTPLPGGKGIKDVVIAPHVPSAEAEKRLPGLIEKWRDTFGQ